MSGQALGSAEDFFEQLAEFSDKYVKGTAGLGLDSAISPWGYPGYKDGKPRGAILHYTADEDFHRTLRWFLREKYNSKASAHAVVADRRMPTHDKFAKGLPLIEALPVTIVQCRRPETSAWHATWTNRLTYGIENQCAGELHEDQGDFFTWRPRDQSALDWTTPWETETDKQPVPLYNRWWVQYPAAQIEANIILLRYAQALLGDFDPAWVLGHENVQGDRTNPSRPKDKRDPGPCFPTWGIRESLAGNGSLAEYAWWDEYTADPFYGQSYRDGLILDWARDSSDTEIQPSPDVAWDRFREATQAFEDSHDKLFLETAYAALGYDWESMHSTTYVFQKMMGLSADGVVGDKTRRAIVDRLQDRML